MEVTLDSLIRDIRSASPSTLEQLEFAAQRASDLADLGDSLLNHFVDQCRKDGKTWAEIGEHLGVSRQAVQKRFVDNSRVMFEGFTDRARLAVAQANDEARAMNHNYIGTEHLLLALFDTNGGLSDVVLQELGVTHAAMLEEIETLIGRGPTPVAGQQPFTPRAKKVLEEATNAAIELGHNYIGTEHLLLALFRGQEGVAKLVLEKHGAPEQAVRAKVLEQLAGFQKTASAKPAKKTAKPAPAKKTAKPAPAKKTAKPAPAKAAVSKRSRRTTER